MDEKRPEERTPMDDWDDIEILVRNHVTGPIAREARGLWHWHVEPVLKQHESKIMWGIVLGFLVLCLALVP
jgi:hypothetical protein